MMQLSMKYCYALTIAGSLLANLLATAQLRAEAGVVVHRNVSYIDSGDLKHEADIYVPPGEGPFPGVLMIHGGAWTSGTKGHMLAHARTVVAAGYTVMNINYRLAPKDKFPAQVDDCSRLRGIFFASRGGGIPERDAVNSRALESCRVAITL